MTHRERFLSALRGSKTDTTPIWIMRQAGRYLPEYREVRKKASFNELLKNPELAAEVTLQPLRRFPLDAAILFSDILVLAEAMGAQVEFNPSPKFRSPVRSVEEVGRLRMIDPAADLPFVLETIKILKKELHTEYPLIGFSGAPFTLASYLVEGGGSKDFLIIKSLMFNGEFYRPLMQKITDAASAYLLAQIDAGADAVQIFDTWASVLSAEDYGEFVLPYTRKLIGEVKSKGAPVIYYMSGVSHLGGFLADLNADAYSIDWRTNFSDLDGDSGKRFVFQGNLDPAILFTDREVISRKASGIIESGRKLKGHIFNLGHGILPETPVEAVSFLVDLVHEKGLYKEGGP